MITKKILIADDDKVFVQSLAEQFNGEGEGVIIAEDGDQALTKAKQEKPDVIVLDVMMPKQLGIAVLKKLKGDEDTKFIPVIAVSNFGGERNEKRALEVGAESFFTKAKITAEGLANEVRRHLPKAVVVEKQKENAQADA